TRAARPFSASAATSPARSSARFWRISSDPRAVPGPHQEERSAAGRALARPGGLRAPSHSGGTRGLVSVGRHYTARPLGNRAGGGDRRCALALAVRIGAFDLGL